MKQSILSIFVILVIVLFASCNIQENSITDINNKSNSIGSSNITLDYLINESDYCVLISTMKPAYIDDFDAESKKFIYYNPIEESIEKNGDYYLDVFVDIEKSSSDDINEVITIIQKEEQFIIEEGLYFVFLNESETEENHYYIVGGRSGVIDLDSTDLKPLDENLSECIESKIGTSVYDFLDWMEDVYKVNPEYTLTVVETTESVVYDSTE